MVMVRTRDRSQCRAVAVPWAWKALRRGCEGDSRGGSVVLQLLVQRMSSLGTELLSYPRNGYRRYQIIQRRVPVFRACPELEKMEPRLQLKVCDVLDVDCGGKERGKRPGGSFICRSGREGSGATGRCRLISEAWWAGDGVGSDSATGHIERRLRGALLDYLWRPKDEHRFAPRTRSSFRDPWVTRLMHLRHRASHSASISCKTFPNRLQRQEGPGGVRGSRIPPCQIRYLIPWPMGRFWICKSKASFA